MKVLRDFLVSRMNPFYNDLLAGKFGDGDGIKLQDVPICKAHRRDNVRMATLKTCSKCKPWVTHMGKAHLKGVSQLVRQVSHGIDSNAVLTFALHFSLNLTHHHAACCFDSPTGSTREPRAMAGSKERPL